MAEELQDNDAPNEEAVDVAVDIETKILNAMRSCFSHIKEQADSLTFEGVRRLLEKDLCMEMYTSDVHKRYVKQCLEKCIEAALEDNVSKDSEETGRKNVNKEEAAESPEGHQSKKVVKEPCLEDEENMEGSPVMGLLIGRNTKNVESDGIKGNKDKDDKDIPSESRITKAIIESISYLKANSEMGIRNVNQVLITEAVEAVQPTEDDAAVGPFQQREGKAYVQEEEEFDDVFDYEVRKQTPKESSLGGQEDSSAAEEVEEVVRQFVPEKVTPKRVSRSARKRQAKEKKERSEVKRPKMRNTSRIVITSSSDEAEEEEELAKKWEILRRREIFEENGFSNKAGELPPFITSVVAYYEWESLCRQPLPTSIALVREFYLGMQPERSISIVRGVEVDFSASTINSLYLVSDEHEEESFMRMYAPSDEQIEDALRMVGTKGAEWVISSTGCRTLRPGDIKDKLAIWLYFIKHRVMPTTRDTTISLERVMLLYSIRRILPINLGGIIRQEMVECGPKTRGRLFFPSLIGQLCAEVGVVVDATEKCCKVKPAIDLGLIKRLQGNIATRKSRSSASKLPSFSSPPSRTLPPVMMQTSINDATFSSPKLNFETPIPDHQTPVSALASTSQVPSFAAPATVAGDVPATPSQQPCGANAPSMHATTVVGYMAERLEKFMAQSRAYWAYAKERDDALKRFLSSAKLDYYPAVPLFPDHILHDPKDEEQGNEVDDDAPAHI